ncbi:MAG: TIGR04190 family B12-binding domain/radical SAM domain protein [Actinomycetota bacterium]|nr:MAG: radical SAM [Actinomycetota bacterium]MDO8950834.1 TIGR04190 family B12-binding domain/radical SAM domain protein [Actinomycetota bacterium]MDP3629910.1 TIGR04190 family B12-binding domain/radical SAM domain protein [Actinomycetota bacterium]
MSRPDLVLLHAPSVYDFRETSIMFGPVSDLVPSSPIFEMYPLGFTTMAEYMERHGLHVRIVNLAMHMLSNAKYDVEKAIRQMEPVAFGIDLHWLPHAHGSIEIARICKKYHPNTPVIFGGLSSTYFHEELATYDCVDYVLRGDSTEEPFTQLMFALKRGGSVSDIPNLTYKSPDGSITVNPLSFVPDTFNHVKLDYAYSMRSVIRDRDMTSSLPFKGWLSYPVTASLTCRGCTKLCPTCGGSAYSFAQHFGRKAPAFRDPELLVSDIAHVKKHIPGPVFILNDFQQAGQEYIEAFLTGLRRINFNNPIGFEFFTPPTEEFCALLDENLNDWSVEVSCESHDDAVRAAFGKHYTFEEVAESIETALKHNCSRFDLYFMTGIPTQTAQSVLDTVPAVRDLYARVNNDKRLLAFISPMAPFLDPGSMVFDNPEAYGYKLRAKTLEEHRQLLLQPSWKHILNYEPDGMTRDEMVDTIYEAAIGFNQIKAAIGIADPAVEQITELRIREAHAAMARIDEIIAGTTGPEREQQLADFQHEVDRLNESTVCEKSELNWPAQVTWTHVFSNIALWFRVNFETIFPKTRKFEPQPVEWEN